MVQNSIGPASFSRIWEWDHVMVIMLMAINLKLWWDTKQDSAGPRPKTDTEQKPTSDIDTILALMGRRENFEWLCTPQWIFLAFAIGYVLAKLGSRWQQKSTSETNPAPNIDVDISTENTPDDANTNAYGASSSSGETSTNNAEAGHDARHFGKAATPSPTGTQTIVSELAQFVFKDGKYRGPTFEEVWINDRDTSYKKWLQTRLNQIDIAYSAFVLYSDMRAAVQR